MGIISFYCGNGVSRFTISRTYNGTKYTHSDTFNTYGFDEGTTVTLEGFTLESGYGYPVTVTNLSTGGVYTYTSASTAKWTFNSNYGTVSSSGYQIDATPTTKTYYLRLNFDANGGIGGPSSVTGQATNDTGYVTVTIPYTEPTRDGYTFVGWSTNTSGTGTIRYPGGTYTGFGNTGSYANHYLYAVWQKAKYSVTVKYNANGGSGAPASHTVSGDSSSLSVTLSSEVPKRSGYVFLGWATSSTATSPTYYAGQTLNNVYATTAGYEWNLYAVWSQESTSVVYIFDSSGFVAFVVWIWDNGWAEYEAYTWDNGWQKGIQ